MGIYLSIDRLPVEVAVDILTKRRSHSASDDYLKQVPGGSPSWNVVEDVPDHAPYGIYFAKSFPVIFEALTGRNRSEKALGAFIEEERDDPTFWAIHGARMIGWGREDYPYRYSFPSDIERIVDCLAPMTADDVSENLRQAHAEGPLPEDRRGAPSLEDRLGLVDWLSERVLPTMKRFYRAALEAEEMGFYFMG